jgi:hypothetical protein
LDGLFTARSSTVPSLKPPISEFDTELHDSVVWKVFYIVASVFHVFVLARRVDPA